MSKQCLKIKSLIIDIHNCLNKVFPTFDSLNKELSPGFCLVDNFSDCFSFHLVNQKNTNTIVTHQNKLNSIYDDSLINQDTILIISNISVQNNVATSILHIWRGQEIIAKSIYHVINITSMKTKLFAIRYGINHTTQLQDVAHTVIITDAILATKWIFDTSIHLYQLHSITISNVPRVFFNKNSNNSILFWDCSSSIKWSPHLLVDKESKCLKVNPVLPRKSS